jgi:hypothetical protein
VRGGTRTPARWARWALLCAVAFGVLGMHHVAGLPGGHHGHSPGHSLGHSLGHPPGHPPGHSLGQSSGQSLAQSVVAQIDAAPHGEPTPHGGQELWAHLCLAVLAAGVGLALLLVLLSRRRGGPPAPKAWSGAVPPESRAPPPPTSVRLAMLCVLRQ